MAESIFCGRRRISYCISGGEREKERNTTAPRNKRLRKGEKKEKDFFSICGQADWKKGKSERRKKGSRSLTHSSPVLQRLSNKRNLFSSLLPTILFDRCSGEKEKEKRKKLNDITFCTNALGQNWSPSISPRFRELDVKREGGCCCYCCCCCLLLLLLLLLLLQSP